MPAKVWIDNVHETMLKELVKKCRMTQKDLVEEYIRDNYNNVFKKIRDERFWITETVESKRLEGV